MLRHREEKGDHKKESNYTRNNGRTHEWTVTTKGQKFTVYGRKKTKTRKNKERDHWRNTPKKAQITGW